MCSKECSVVPFNYPQLLQMRRVYMFTYTRKAISSRWCASSQQRAQGSVPLMGRSTQMVSATQGGRTWGGLDFGELRDLTMPSAVCSQDERKTMTDQPSYTNDRQRTSPKPARALSEIEYILFKFAAIYPAHRQQFCGWGQSTKGGVFLKKSRAPRPEGLMV